MKEKRTWYIGNMDTHTNESVQAELQKRPGMTWNECFKPMKGFETPQPVIEFYSYEFIRWLKMHKADLNLSFNEYRQVSPDTPLVEYKLGRTKAGGRLAAEAAMKKRKAQAIA